MEDPRNVMRLLYKRVRDYMMYWDTWYIRVDGALSGWRTMNEGLGRPERHTLVEAVAPRSLHHPMHNLSCQALE